MGKIEATFRFGAKQRIGLGAGHVSELCAANRGVRPSFSRQSASGGCLVALAYGRSSGHSGGAGGPGFALADPDREFPARGERMPDLRLRAKVLIALKRLIVMMVSLEDPPEILIINNNCKKQLDENPRNVPKPNGDMAG
jgi:hypothetical protein